MAVFGSVTSCVARFSLEPKEGNKCCMNHFGGEYCRAQRLGIFADCLSQKMLRWLMPRRSFCKSSATRRSKRAGHMLAHEFGLYRINPTHGWRLLTVLGIPNETLLLLPQLQHPYVQRQEKRERVRGRPNLARRHTTQQLMNTWCRVSDMLVDERGLPRNQNSLP